MRIGAVALAAFGSASLWISLGAVAIVQPDTRMRIVALPPLWLLAVLVCGGALAAWLARVTTKEVSPLLVGAFLWLPYVPGQVPAAFLIWNGPIEMVVWLLIGAGLTMADRWTRAVRIPAVITDPRLAPWAAGALAALSYLAGAVSLSDRLPGGDEPHYLMVTQSLLRDGDLQIENNHQQIEYVPFYDNELAPHYVTRGVNGQIYSAHGPGASVLVLPGLALAGYAGASASIAATTVLAGMLIWSAAWTLTASVAAAWIAWAAIALTTPFFAHAFIVFSDGPGALGVAAGGWLLVQLAMNRPVAHWQFMAAGFALASLPWLHVRFAVLAAGLGLVTGARMVRKPDAVAQLIRLFGIPVVLAVAWFGFFWMIWGTPNPQAPFGTVMTTEWRNVWSGMAGLLFDQQFGLITTAPIYICAVIGFVRLAAQHPRLAAELVVVVVPYALLPAAFEAWWGGFGGPARYLAATLPIAALPIAWMWSAGGPLSRMVTVLTLLVSVVMLGLRVFVDGGNMVYAEAVGPDPLVQWLARSVDLAAALPTMQEAGIWRDVGAWCAVAMVVTAATWACVGRQPRSAAVAWTAVAMSTAVTLMAGASVGWRLHQRTGAAPAPSQMAWLADWSHLSTFVQWRPPYLASPALIARRIYVPLTPFSSREGAVHAVTGVAAGDYEIVLSGNVPSRGELVARAGVSGPVFDRWPLSGDPGQGLLRLRVPVPLRQLSVKAEGADVPIEQGGLRLHGTGIVQAPSMPAAIRAARFGSVRAFFLDSRAYPEASGFWTQGGETTTVVFDRDDAAGGRLRLRLRSGPVATGVTVTVAGESRQIKLEANTQREEEFATVSGLAAVSLRTETMFLPVQHDPANRDFRHLGIWVEVP